ncbi:hypothetical protein AZI86_01335 [Bdellovibrio bacteriovorus]|uniref:Uncharacterized protein n=1 Tax=Bdellovibrio bacteriovorus TaxID=959 RepID=A0A150WN62_BDEBC|nr:ankyrin repeat domain-containing protein [Bdellovibrio bacteriovorus]KYG65747.1 hypothetical protein AZI86_01335 [Bdellovibrio bacteriovorus]
MAPWEAVFEDARYGNISKLSNYLSGGGDIEARNHRGHSLLMLSAYNGHSTATEYLLSQGADVDTVDLSGTSVLMRAAFKGHTEVVRVLLRSGADTSLKNHRDLTVMDFAQLFGRRSVLDLLPEGTREWKDPFKVTIRGMKRKS